MGKSTYMVKPSQLRRKPIRGKTEKKYILYEDKITTSLSFKRRDYKSLQKNKSFFWDK